MTDRAGGPRVPADAGYRGQQAVLATMHGKEAAIAPPFMDRLGLLLDVPAALDTDALGTFTGDVERPGDMLETALLKARAGMRQAGLPLGLASEGSYGPHPLVPFMPSGQELMVFVDEDRGISIHEQLRVEKTNFSHQVLAEPGEAERFLARAGFPSHAVVVRPNAPVDGIGSIHKGLTEPVALDRAIHACTGESSDGQARLETDMRAHMNPTRMHVIRTLAERLAARIAQPCPACETPGFGVVDVVRGLPCAGCTLPTELVAEEVFGCVACAYREPKPRHDGLERADPGQCPFCNP